MKYENPTSSTLYMLYIESYTRVNFLKNRLNLKFKVSTPTTVVGKTIYMKLTGSNHIKITAINNSSGSKVMAKDKVFEKYVKLQGHKV